MGFDITSEIIDILDDSNTDLFVNGVKLVQGDSIPNNTAVEIRTRPGYAITRDSLGRANAYFSYSDGMGGENVLWFDLDESNTVGEVVYEQVSWNTDYETLVVITEQVATDVVGSNNVYLIDRTDLQDVNVERFVPDGLGGVRDFGSFILSVLTLPFNVPEEYILEPEPIQLATLQTSIEAPKLNNDVIRVDMGEIPVPDVENNLFDYANTVTTLHLPRADSVVLDSVYVIGEVISVEYLIDCYTGVATINVRSTKVDGVILTLEADLGISVPYASESRSPTANNINIVVGGDNGVLKPYIEVARNETILPYGFFTVPIVDEGVLSGNAGYLEVENIDLKVNTTKNEKLEIVNLLSSGVVIK